MVLNDLMKKKGHIALSFSAHCWYKSFNCGLTQRCCKAQLKIKNLRKLGDCADNNIGFELPVFIGV